MIVNWKKTSATELVSQWQGMHLRVYWDLFNSAWRLALTAPVGYVLGCNGRRAATVTGGWRSSRQATEAVDGVMEKLIRAAVPPPTAVQHARRKVVVYAG